MVSLIPAGIPQTTGDTETSRLGVRHHTQLPQLSGLVEGWSSGEVEGPDVRLAAASMKAVALHGQ